ncbi:ethylbenzene dehydrogenase-related protein [Candidatus Magnetominusculus dajiuhuensis]|uniref:ethylbenzene dehydrogenase-related protein n=1 Tax=Candidatus Magnetominusculus dajiuhuensis TaxID=3137712 RepID=UPI003B4352DA
MIKQLWLILAIVLAFAQAAYGEGKAFVEITSFHKDVDVSKVSVNDDVWKGVDSYRQPLQRQFLVEPKPKDVGVKEVHVQSINDGKSIAFRLTWKDDTKDDTLKIMEFSDAAAIQFPISSSPLPEYFMGEPKKPVHILYWKAWWSKDQKEGRQSASTAYPNMTIDMYTFDYKVSGTGTEKTQAQKDMFIPGRAAQNPMSATRKGIIEEASSEGPGTLKTKNTENTEGDAQWQNGSWTLVMRRPMTVTDKESVQFKAGEKKPIAFAVWEGHHMEGGGRKAVSPAWAEVLVK